MSCLDPLYAQTITLFNRMPGKKGEPTIWLPTVISGVHLIVGKSTSWDKSGGRNANDVRLHVRYRRDGDKVLVCCASPNASEGVIYKQWYEPKAWKRLLTPEDSITFSFGEDSDFDFFIEGKFDEYPSPISDDNFGFKGFYGYITENYDNVFAVKSVNRYNLIPHFEIQAR